MYMKDVWVLIYAKDFCDSLGNDIQYKFLVKFKIISQFEVRLDSIIYFFYKFFDFKIKVRLI